MTSKRIGIFSGSFDPVHKGHIAFALQALEVADLDMVYLAPEIRPRRKSQVTHIAHRLSMLELATRPYKQLGVLELPDRYFLPGRTLARLQEKFPEAQLVLLMGSDLFEHMHTWPKVELLLPQVGLVVGARGGHEVAETLAVAHKLPKQPQSLQVVDSVERAVSSGDIRAKLRADQPSSDLVASVKTYAQKHWLYHDIRKVSRR